MTLRMTRMLPMIVVMMRQVRKRIVRTADLRKDFLTCCFIFIQPGIFMQKLLVNFRKSFYICCRKIFKKAFMQSVSISIKNNIFLWTFAFSSFINYIVTSYILIRLIKIADIIVILTGMFSLYSFFSPLRHGNLQPKQNMVHCQIDIFRHSE